MLAALLLGYFITRLQERLPPTRYRRSLLGTGLCGALSTFSTVMVELLHMIDGAHWTLAAGYAGTSIARRPRGRVPRHQAGPPREVLDDELPGAVAWRSGVLGGLGSLARFMLDALVSAGSGARFPLGTLAINLSGSAVLGLLVGHRRSAATAICWRAPP